MLDRPALLLFAPMVFLLLWSGGYVVAKIGLLYAAPLTILSLRYALVVVIMAVAYVLFRPPLPRRLADWGHLAMVGLLIQTVYFGMTYLAFTHGIAAGTAALLMSLQPVLVALAAPKFTQETISARIWVGLIIALCGTTTVILSRMEIGALPVVGLLYALAGLSGITLATLWEKRFGLSHHPVTANLVGYSAGLVCLVPFWLAQPAAPVLWTPAFAAVMVYLVLGNSVIAVGLLLAMIRAGKVAQVSALMFLVPPVSALLAWLTLGEAMPPLAWLGLAVAGAGVFLASRP